MELKNTKQIAILLSTYNGEKYISQLIESLLNQTSKDFTIYVRDDGSTDSTISIINDYSFKNDNIIVIESNNNLGSKYSFLELLRIIDSDYYMFCDQDDIWLPFKVECTLNCMKEYEYLYPDIPIVVHTDLKLVDEDLNVNAKSFWHYRKIVTSLPHSFNFLCHYNDITGCTMMINRKTKMVSNIIYNLELPKFIYHDAILSIVATKYGGRVVALNIPTILYRRHGENETDATTKHKSSLRNIPMWTKELKEQKNRYSFYSQLGYGSFFKFLWYKALYVILRSLKTRKQYK